MTVNLSLSTSIVSAHRTNDRHVTVRTQSGQLFIACEKHLVTVSTRLSVIESSYTSDIPLFFASGYLFSSWHGCIDDALESGLTSVRQVQQYQKYFVLEGRES
jgi:hypothetical protein